MLDLTGPCVCGGTFDRPNDTCERCKLVELASELIREVYRRRTMSTPWAHADVEIADRYGLSYSDVRRIVSGRGVEKEKD